MLFCAPPLDCREDMDVFGVRSFKIDLLAGSTSGPVGLVLAFPGDMFSIFSSPTGRGILLVDDAMLQDRVCRCRLYSRSS